MSATLSLTGSRDANADDQSYGVGDMENADWRSVIGGANFSETEDL
jgi:hypothetical protein